MEKVSNLKSRGKREVEIITKLSPAQVVKKLQQQKQRPGTAKKLLLRRSLGYLKPVSMSGSKKKVTVTKNNDFYNQRFSIGNAKKNPVPINNKLISASSKPSTEIANLKQRQQNSENAIRLNFPKRKSISQMDIRLAKRTGNFALPKTPVRFIDINGNSAALFRNVNSKALVIGSKETPVARKLFGCDNYYYAVEDLEQMLAGMRIFSKVMLNAWRKRRDEVKHLTQEAECIKRGAMKTKTQLHVFNSLFRVEQKRCDELNTQLKWSIAEISKLKDSLENLNSTITILKADKKALEENIQFKDLETENLNALLIQTKSDLFKSMAQQRDLQSRVSEEQRKVQAVENENKDLENEVVGTLKMFKDFEEKIHKELESKEADLNAAHQKIAVLLKLKQELIQRNVLIDELNNSGVKQKHQIESLRSQIDLLQQCLGASMGSRIKSCWSSSMAYRRTTFQMLHWFAYYMLPAAPTPRYDFPFVFSFQKALNFIKR